MGIFILAVLAQIIAILVVRDRSEIRLKKMRAELMAMRSHAHHLESEKEEVRKKAASGATISLGDLDTLLSSGGLKGLTSDDSNSGKKQRKKKSAMKNLGNRSAHRGTRNRYSRKD